MYQFSEIDASSREISCLTHIYSREETSLSLRIHFLQYYLYILFPCHSLHFQTVVYGMIFAFGLLLLKRYGIVSDNNKDNLFSTGISWGLLGAGLLGIGVSKKLS